MKVTIIGSGYVGLVTGACLAEQGNNVFCLDLDPKKIEILNSGGVPIYEPGLKEMIERNRAAGRLQFSTDIAASVAHGDIQFIAVGTPPDEDGSADLQYVVAAARNIGRHATTPKVIVDKSTVPVGTADKVSAAIKEELEKRGLPADLCSVVSNPEFLKEGAAVEDFMRPDRIVIGTENTPSGLMAKEQMRKLYTPFNRHHERTYYMDVKSAELTKYAANAMLATRISFMNELANLADLVGADIEAVRQGIGSDSRIGYGFLKAGLAYGGPCIPKDVSALIKTGKSLSSRLTILEAVQAVNQAQNSSFIQKIGAFYKEGIRGKRIAIWGLAFKAHTTTVENAPSLGIISALLTHGALLQVYDPLIKKDLILDSGVIFSQQWHDNVSHFEDIVVSLENCDALVILTNYSQFKLADLIKEKLVKKNTVVLDGCNIFRETEFLGSSIVYLGLERSSP